MKARLGCCIVIAICVSLISCGRQNAPGSSSAPQTINDKLSRYSIEELRQALDARQNQAIHPHLTADLENAKDRELVDVLDRREKAIFPHDLRKDYYEFTVDNPNPDYARVANSVAALIKPDHYHLTEKEITLITKPLGVAEQLCSGQSYFDQPTAAYCSGFVVGPDLIATAGHCVEKDWRSIRIVFGYEMVKDPRGVHLASLSRQDVYAPIDVIAQKVDEGGEDYAVFKVDRNIVNHPSLPRHDDGKINLHEGVYILGYPSGLPLKLAGGAAVTAISPKGFFQADLDTYAGNSGSPVLNASTHIVEGILVRGLKDYRYIREDKCYQALTCPTYNGCEGEDVTFISAITQSGIVPQMGSSPSTSKEKSLNSSKLLPFTKQFSSGPVPSGSRKSFSSEYVVMSDPAPDGFKVGTFSYSLSGDRACNAWSTCSARVEGDRVVFRFTLQGHDEWSGSGQAYSTGTLIVNYVPL